MRFEDPDALEVAKKAILRVGASDLIATSLAKATVSAEWAGNSAVGFAHLPDYLVGFLEGRIAKNVEPVVSSPSPGILCSDAMGGIAQLGFDCVFDEFVKRTNQIRVAVFSQSNSFTVGELGYYSRRLAQAGLVSLAVANASAKMTTLESGQPLYGTNPIAFAAPTAAGNPFVIDQATSATAFVNIRAAAERGECIPAGYAVDLNGTPTNDAMAAVKGFLLPFGGARGANIALMIEILSAGATGANWSIDAPPFSAGSECPAVGLFILAFRPDLIVDNFASRLTEQIDRLAERGVRIPGSHITVKHIDISDDVLAKIYEVSRSKKNYQNPSANAQ